MQTLTWKHIKVQMYPWGLQHRLHGILQRRYRVQMYPWGIATDEEHLTADVFRDRFRCTLGGLQPRVYHPCMVVR